MKTLGVILLLAGFFLGQMLGPGSIATLTMVVGVVMLLIGFSGAQDSSHSPNKDGYKYSFRGGSSAIAICPERKLLKLKEGRNEKEYGFADVRNWEANQQTGGMAIGGGNLNSAMAASSHNFGVAMANKRASGLFVTVKDIDNPVWRINMLDKKDQQRWMEILRQTINEDHPSQAA